MKEVSSETIVLITTTSTCLGLTPFGREPCKVLTLEFEQQSQICQPKLLVTQNNKELSHFPRFTPYFFPLPKNFFRLVNIAIWEAENSLHKTEIHPIRRPILKQEQTHISSSYFFSMCGLSPDTAPHPVPFLSISGIF